MSFGRQPTESEQELIAHPNRRQLTGIGGKLVTALAVVIALYHILYVVRFFERIGVYILDIAHYASSLGSITILVFLLRPIKRGAATNRLPWYDALLILAAMVAFGYPAIFVEHLTDVAAKGTVGTTEIVMGLMVIALLLEAARRVSGWAMPVLAIFFLFHALFTNYFPGILYGRGYSLSRVIFIQYATTQGLWGTAMVVGSTVIIIFVIFAQFLQNSGAGKFFLDLALGLVGRFRGGPAKAAVVGSSLFGTFTGSPSANVAGTGVVTIPLMKKIGYSPEYAAGIEAAASTGAQVVPPVMGAVAFIMADWLGIPYINICLYAIPSAILYYTGIFMMVHLQAVKKGLGTVPSAQVPSVKKTLKDGWYFIVPIVSIIFLLSVSHYTPEVSGVYGIGITFLLSFLRKETRMNPKRVISSLAGGSTGMLPVMMSCGLVGVLIGSFVTTGVGHKLSSGLIELAGGFLFLLVLYSGVASYILGMGVPSIPLYMMVVTLVAPALTGFGVPILSAHFFVFYWAMISFITPPVALAAYTAAAIADSDPFRTGLHSMKLGCVAIIVPFAFIYDGALLLQGPLGQIAISVTSASIGTLLVACAVEGYLQTRLNWLQRILLMIAGGLLFLRLWWFDIIGLAIAAPPIFWQMQQANKVQARERAAALAIGATRDTQQ